MNNYKSDKNGKEGKSLHSGGRAIAVITFLGFLLNFWQVSSSFDDKEDKKDDLGIKLNANSMIDSFGINYELISSIDKEMSSKIQLVAFSISKGGLPLNTSVKCTVEIREKYSNNLQAIIVANRLRDALAAKDLSCCLEILSKVNTNVNWTKAWQEMAMSLNESDPIRKNIEINNSLADEISKGTSPKLALEIVLKEKI